MRNHDGTMFIRTCNRCGVIFEDVARRQVCRECSGRVRSGTLMPWREVRDRWNAASGDRITTETVRAVAAVAIRKLRRLISEDPQLARDFSESGLAFEDWITQNDHE